MANPNPNQENLKLGWGKRAKLDHSTVAIRMSDQTKKSLEELAQKYDCLHGGKPWVGGLLTKLGNGELILVPAPPK